MLTRLLEIDAVARAVERDLALLATALRADTPVDSGAEALFFALVADGTGHPSLIMARLGRSFAVGREATRAVPPGLVRFGNYQQRYGFPQFPFSFSLHSC